MSQEYFIEILTEEPSMKAFLNGLLPRLLPTNWQVGHNVFIRPHQGKSDLMKSLRNKARAFAESPCLLIVLHDQDSNDCMALKKTIHDILEEANMGLKSLIRIPCRELENWYLGDLEALKHLNPAFKPEKLSGKSKFRNVDLLNGKEEVKKILPTYGAITTAKSIAPLLSIDKNKSESFNQFISGLARFVTKEIK